MLSEYSSVTVLHAIFFHNKQIVCSVLALFGTGVFEPWLKKEGKDVVLVVQKLDHTRCGRQEAKH